MIAVELGTSAALVNRGLKQLMAAGLIERTGKYKFTGKETFAYGYTVPRDAENFE